MASTTEQFEEWQEQHARRESGGGGRGGSVDGGNGGGGGGMRSSGGGTGSGGGSGADIEAGPTADLTSGGGCSSGRETAKDMPPAAGHAASGGGRPTSGGSRHNAALSALGELLSFGGAGGNSARSGYGAAPLGRPRRSLASKSMPVGASGGGGRVSSPPPGGRWRGPSVYPASTGARGRHLSKPSIELGTAYDCVPGGTGAPSFTAGGASRGGPLPQGLGGAMSYALPGHLLRSASRQGRDMAEAFIEQRYHCRGPSEALVRLCAQPHCTHPFGAPTPLSWLLTRAARAIHQPAGRAGHRDRWRRALQRPHHHLGPRAVRGGAAGHRCAAAQARNSLSANLACSIPGLHPAGTAGAAKEGPPLPLHARSQRLARWRPVVVLDTVLPEPGGGWEDVARLKDVWFCQVRSLSLSGQGRVRALFHAWLVSHGHAACPSQGDPHSSADLLRANAEEAAAGILLPGFEAAVDEDAALEAAAMSGACGCDACCNWRRGVFLPHTTLASHPMPPCSPTHPTLPTRRCDD